jgi:hypothetical protein
MFGLLCFLQVPGTHPTDVAMMKVIAGIRFVMAVAMDDDPSCRPV